ncbi:MAG: helix-turn-helix transcriptional regulator [Pseudomonadota bacterium]
MKTVPEYLDMAKAITGSDYMTAKRLGVTRAAVSRWRSEGTIKTENAPKLAELIEVDPRDIVAASDSKLHPENKRLWAKWVAAIAIFALGEIAFEPSIVASASASTLDSNMYYAHKTNGCVCHVVRLHLVSLTEFAGLVEIAARYVAFEYHTGTKPATTPAFLSTTLSDVPGFPSERFIGGKNNARLDGTHELVSLYAGNLSALGLSKWRLQRGVIFHTDTDSRFHSWPLRDLLAEIGFPLRRSAHDYPRTQSEVEDRSDDTNANDQSESESNWPRSVRGERTLTGSR